MSIHASVRNEGLFQDNSYHGPAWGDPRHIVLFYSTNCTTLGSPVNGYCASVNGSGAFQNFPVEATGPNSLCGLVSLLEHDGRNYFIVII
jgi:hypothetical protein